MYYVYVIKSQSGLIYTGQTQNVQKRLDEHNKGKSKWTSQDKKWKIIYSRDFETRSEAMKYERWLKTGTGRDFLKELVSNQT